MILHLDYETRSEVDLITEGAYNYALDPTTEILCAAYAIDDGDVELLRGSAVGGCLDELCKLIHSADEIHAHNAGFERLITWHVLLRDFVNKPELERFYCTASQARARAMPGKLELLPRALGLKGVDKDARGKQLIRDMCIPIFQWSEELQQEMEAYCRQDVEVERLCAQMTPRLTERELEDYHISERINDRGVMVDVELCEIARDLAAVEKKAAAAELSRKTNGAIDSVGQHQRIKNWVRDKGTAEQRETLRKMMTRHKRNRQTGEDEVKISFDKAVRERVLTITDDQLHSSVIEMAQIVEDASAGSVGKFKNMATRADPETDRVHGAYMYAGASQTLRYSSTGVQLHNFPRDAAKDPEAAREAIMEGALGDDPLGLLSSMLRPALIAPEGKQYVGGDWSAIEARVLPWLAGPLPGAEQVLMIFRKNDADPSAPDIYQIEYASAYNILNPADVDKAMRQIGKVIVLSMGYQGGVGAGQAMARAYKIDVDDDEVVRWRDEWRASNPWAPIFWRELEAAVRRAVRHPGEMQEVGRLKYVFNDTSLYCVLPSGDVLTYPHARLEMVETPWGEERLQVTALKAAWTPPAADLSAEWPRINLYGGQLAENATQGTAAVILRDTLRMLDADDWPVVGHTHDEVFSEIYDDEWRDCWAATHWAMLHGSDSWTEGLPLAAELWRGKRYGK